MIEAWDLQIYLRVWTSISSEAVPTRCVSDVSIREYTDMPSGGMGRPVIHSFWAASPLELQPGHPWSHSYHSSRSTSSFSSPSNPYWAMISSTARATPSGSCRAALGRSTAVTSSPPYSLAFTRSLRVVLPVSTTRFAGTELVPVGSAVSAGVDESRSDSLAHQKSPISGDVLRNAARF